MGATITRPWHYWRGVLLKTESYVVCDKTLTLLEGHSSQNRKLCCMWQRNYAEATRFAFAILLLCFTNLPQLTDCQSLHQPLHIAFTVNWLLLRSWRNNLFLSCHSEQAQQTCLIFSSFQCCRNGSCKHSIVGSHDSDLSGWLTSTRWCRPHLYLIHIIPCWLIIDESSHRGM